MMTSIRGCVTVLRRALHHQPLPATCPCNSRSFSIIGLPASSASPDLLRVGLPTSYCQYRRMSLLYYMRRIPQRFKEFQKFHFNIIEREQRNKKYPPEIAIYLWLIALKARVRFTNGKWYTSEVKGLREKRPIRELMQYNIDAIDASGTLVDYHGLAEIVKLPKLKLLSFEECPHIDDSCLGRLVHLRDTLTHLNINKCPQITEHGLASLHHLRNLERLNMNDLPRVPNGTIVACMLEDIVPRLKIGLVTEEVKKQQQLQDRWRQQQDQGKRQGESI